MPVCLDRARIGELAHFYIRPSLTQHLNALRPRRGMTRAVHDKVRTETAHDISNTSNAFRRCADLLDIDRRLSTEPACQLEAGVFRRANANYATCSHLLRRCHGENAYRARALDHHGVSPFEATSLRCAIECADAGSQRFGKRTQTERHVVRKFVNLGPGQHLEIHVDVFREATPKMRRLVEAEVTSVVHRRQALVGGLWIVNAVIASTTGHQRWDHHLGADFQRLSHEVLRKILSFLDNNPAKLMTKREGPWQRFWPVAPEDVLIGSANPASPNLDQRGLCRNAGPRYGLNNGFRARSREGSNADRRLERGGHSTPLTQPERVGV